MSKVFSNWRAFWEEYVNTFDLDPENRNNLSKAMAGLLEEALGWGPVLLLDGEGWMEDLETIENTDFGGLWTSLHEHQPSGDYIHAAVLDGWVSLEVGGNSMQAAPTMYLRKEDPNIAFPVTGPGGPELMEKYARSEDETLRRELGTSTFKL